MRLTRRTYTLIGLGIVLLLTYMYYLESRRRVTHRKHVQDTGLELQRLYSLHKKRVGQAAYKVHARRREILEEMNRLATVGDPHTNLIELATLYKYGEYGVFQPNEDAAVMCARAALFTTTDADTKSRARVFLFTDELEDVDIDPQSPQLPFDFAKAAVRRTQTIVSTGRPIGRARPSIRAPPPKTVVIHSDPQNAHDHGITTSTRNTLRALDDVDPVEMDAIKHTILEFIPSCDVSDDDKAKAIHAIESIRDTVDSPYIGVSELDALSRVWNAVPDKTVVVQQLASAIEHGMPVCHSGKMARLAGCLDVVDPGGRVPLWAIRQDIFQTAAAVRNDVLAAADSDDIRLYEEGHNPAMTEHMIAAFKQRVERAEYTIDASVLRSIVEDVCSIL